MGVTQPEEAMSCLTSAGWSVERRDGLLSVRAAAPEEAMKINRLLLDHRLDVFHLAVSQRSLEDIFLTLTSEQSNGKPR
ncbi:MAG TPA: hypothetical protein VLB87_01190 [Pyrinomonadaceae bacterium]|nr:hypothetical protein [Pyrinomonadaceae bacterium]